MLSIDVRNHPRDRPLRVPGPQGGDGCGLAAVSKLMRNQDLIAVARKCEVISGFRNTIGLERRLSVRIQPNHPTDDPAGIAASVLDGLLR